MKTSKTLITLALAAIIPMGVAVAGDGKDKSQSGASFDTLDTNRDGRISQAEAGADSSVMFTRADANGDGYLDKMEWRSHTKDGNDGSNPSTQSTPDPVSDSTAPSSIEPATDTETPRQ
jgi:hypothetical protein